MSAAEEEEPLKQLCEALVLFTFINISFRFLYIFFVCFVFYITLSVCVCVCVRVSECAVLLWGIVASPWRMRNILFCNYMRGGQTKICV